MNYFGSDINGLEIYQICGYQIFKPFPTQCVPTWLVVIARLCYLIYEPTPCLVAMIVLLSDNQISDNDT